MDTCVDHRRFAHAITPWCPGLEFREPACQVATVAAVRDFGAGCLRRPLVEGWPPRSVYACPFLRVPTTVSVCDAPEAVHGAGGAGSAGSATPPRGAPGLAATGLAVAGLAVARLARSHRARVAAGQKRNINTAPTVGSRIVHSLLAGKTIEQLYQDPKITHAMDLIPKPVLRGTVQYTQGPGSTIDPDSYPTDAERDAVLAIDTHIPFENQVAHAR